MLGWFNKKSSKDATVAPESTEENIQDLEPVEEAAKSILHEDVGVLFTRLTKGLSKTRGNLVERVDELFWARRS